MEALVGDDADRDRPGGERDEPHPVAAATDVVGTEHAEPTLLHAVEELVVVRVGPVLDVDAAAEPEPRRVDVVAVFLLQPELLLEEERPTGCVDDPAGLGLQRLVPARESDRVGLVSQLDVLDEAAAEQVDPGFDDAVPEEVLEAPAIDLI